MSSVAFLKYPKFKGVSPLILKPIGRSYLGFSLRNEQILQEPKTELWLVFILLRVHIMLINLSILIKNQMVQLLKRIAVWDNSANVF